MAVETINLGGVKKSRSPLKGRLARERNTRSPRSRTRRDCSSRDVASRSAGFQKGRIITICQQCPGTHENVLGPSQRIPDSLRVAITLREICVSFPTEDWSWSVKCSNVWRNSLGIFATSASTSCSCADAVDSQGLREVSATLSDI